MERADKYGSIATKWSELFGRASQLCAEGYNCVSFLRALRDVMTASDGMTQDSVLENLDTLISTVHREAEETEAGERP